MPEQRVAFGTSGHRGTSLEGTFNERHVVAISEAVCRYRAAEGIDGPLFLGRDTHALSEPAFRTTLEVLAEHGVDVLIDAAGGYTPTPVISHQILTHNREPHNRRADGIVLTPSHNPPEDGGIQVQPAARWTGGHRRHGWIQEEANALLARGSGRCAALPFEQAAAADTTHPTTTSPPYVEDLPAVVDLDAIRGAGLRLGVDPSAERAWRYWGRSRSVRPRPDDRQRSVDPTSVRPPSTRTARSGWIAPRHTRWRD